MRLQLSCVLNCCPHCLGNVQVIRWNFIPSEKYLFDVGVFHHVFKSPVFQERFNCLGVSLQCLSRDRKQRMLIDVRKRVLLSLKALLFNVLVFRTAFIPVQSDLKMVHILSWFLNWWEVRLQIVRSSGSFFESHTLKS